MKECSAYYLSPNGIVTHTISSGQYQVLQKERVEQVASHHICLINWIMRITNINEYEGIGIITPLITFSDGYLINIQIPVVSFS